jgi:hypothetical protein
MDPIVFQVTGATGRIENPAPTFRPRFITINGWVNYEGQDYDLEGQFGGWTTVVLRNAKTLDLPDAVGFHY